MYWLPQGPDCGGLASICEKLHFQLPASSLRRDCFHMNAKQKLRAAKAKLKASVCTCNGPHDPYWAQCPRMLAECEFDNAMEIVRYEIEVAKRQ